MIVRFIRFRIAGLAVFCVFLTVVIVDISISSFNSFVLIRK